MQGLRLFCISITSLTIISLQIMNRATHSSLIDNLLIFFFFNFENPPGLALYFCNYIFITANKIYIF